MGFLSLFGQSWRRKLTRRSRKRHPSSREALWRKPRMEPLETRQLLAVGLNWAGPGGSLSLTEGTAGATPTVVISEPSAGISVLKVDLGAGYVFASGSTTSATGLTYQNAGSPTTSQYATIDISSAGNVSSLAATLPGDQLTLGQIRDASGGVGSITASAGAIAVAGISTTSINGNVSLEATGNLTVNAGTVIQTGTGTITLAADVSANGTGDDGVGTLSIGAGATITSTSTSASAITLRGAAISVNTSSNPAVVGAPRLLSTTPTSTLSGLDYPDALAVDASGNLYVANYLVANTVSKFAPGATTPSATLTGLSDPRALAFDTSGNVYVANYGNGTVSKFAPGATTPTATLTGLSSPDALVFDTSGNLYVANYSMNTVSKFAPGATTPTATLTGLSSPDALAVGPGSNLYVANYGNNTVSKFASGATTPTATLTGLSYPNALAFDASGNLYVSNYYNNTVSKFAPGATTASSTLTGLNYPDALAFDASGNLYVANYYNSTVSKFTPGATTASSTLTGLDYPNALAFDASGNLYVANYYNNTASKFAATSLGSPTTGGVVVRSSLPTRSMILGGTSNPSGIYLTNAELARIYTTANGTVTFGDSVQTGNITFTTATPITTAGASTAVVQAPSGSGQITFDDTGSGTGLNGNGGTVTLTPGTGGVVTPLNSAGVPLATQGFNATGLTLSPTLNFAPGLGTQLTLINNTATPAASHPISGTFANLAQGGIVSATYGGTTYWFRANYSGGDGNDLVLTAVATTTTTLSTSQPSVTYGTQVTFTATVVANAGSAAPTGGVEFYDGGTDLGSGTAGTPSGTTETWTFTTPNTTAGRLPAGSGETITAVYTPTGNFGGSSGTLAGGETVAPATLAVSGVAANNKVYDGTTAANLSLGSATLVGILSGDAVSLVTSGATGTFASTNAASGVAVTVVGLTISGAQATDYTLTQPSTTANITTRPITVTAVTATKVYDGLTAAPATPSITGGSLAGSDTASFCETYNTRNVSTGLTLTPAGSVSDGNGGSNYAVSFVGNSTGQITVRAITVTATANAKTYDATTTAWATPTITPVNVVATLARSGNFLLPYGVAVDGAGNTYVAGTFYNVICKISPSGVVSILAGAINQTGSTDGTGSAARFDHPEGVAVDGAGNVYVADTYNDEIRKISPSGVVTTLAGYALHGGSSDGTGSAARFSDPAGVAVDGEGNVYVADTNNDEIRKVSSSGVVTTLAGSPGQTGSSDGTGSAARFYFPESVTVDGASNLYVADTNNDEIRKVGSSGVVTTLAGSPGQTGSSDGTGGAATFYSPRGVAVDGMGNVYVADTNNDEIRKVSSSGVVTTLAGSAGQVGSSDGIGSTARFSLPYGVAVDGAGNVYVADTNNLGIRKISGLGVGDTVAFSETYGTRNVGTGLTLTAAGSVNDGNGGNNYTLTFVNSSAGVINQAALTITAVANTKTYDGTTTSTATPTVIGLQGSDTVTGLAEAYNNRNAGTAKTLSVTTYTVNDGNSGGNYTVTSVNNTAGVINQAALTITAAPNTKTYDGTTTAAGTPTVSGLQGSDTVTGLAEAYNNRNVGTGKTLNVTTYTVNDGNSGGNYTVTSVNNSAGVINQAALTITAVSNTKTYDGTTAAVGTPTVSGLQGSDTVTGLAEAYNNRNAGTAKTLSVTTYTVNDGNSGGNYTVTSVNNSAGVINQAALTITAVANTKTYDGTTTSTATPTVIGLQGSDTVTGLAEAYNNRNAGTAKTLSVTTYTVNDGNSGGNYTVTSVNNTAGVINQAALTITAAPNTKTYDGTTTAAGTPTVSGLQGSDTVTGLAEAYSNLNVGAGKTLSVTTYTVNDGNSGGNYTVTSVNNSAGVINQAALTITAVSNTKTYDGTTAAVGTPTVSGLQGSDTVTGLAEAYNNRNAGTAKTLSVTTYTVNDGNSGGNYTVTSVNNTAGVINQAALTITAAPNTKTYDGTTTAAGTPTVSGLQGSDTVTGLAEAYNNRNVGTGKTLNVTTYTVNDGNGGGNYTVTSINSTAGVINQATLTITAAPNTKTYDGTTAAAGTPTVSGLQGSDTVTGLAEAYNNRNVGTAKTLSVTTYTVNDGNSGGNYTVTSVNNSAGVINQAALTITAAPNTKTYDGTTTATATPAVSGLQGSDTVTGLAEVYADPNAGTAKTLSVIGYTINDGNGGGNYNVTLVTAAGVIAKANATINVAPYSVTYDATSHTATGTATGVGSVNLGSDLSLGGTTHTNAGTYATDGWTFTDPTGNYNNASGTVSDSIAKANATINVTPYSVTYDATSHTATGTATGVGSVNLGSDFSLGGTTHTNAGTYVTDGWTFTDPTGNYNNASGTVSDSIAKANATINVTPYSVTYDATSHTATGTATGVGSVNLGSDLSLGGTTHTNAGTYTTDGWTFTDPTGNYNNASGTVSDSIAKANATINVTPYSVTYDATSHTATGTATGVGSVNLGSDFSLGGTTHTNAGTYVTDGWTFTDPTGNYNNASGTVSDSIAKANATINVTPYSVTYDATSHTATGTATGVGSVNLGSDLSLGGTTHTNAGTYATDGWTFTDPTGNYNNASGTVSDSIAKANATINVAPYGVTYDATSHTATGTATGIGSVSLGSDLSLGGTTHANAGTYATDGWTFTDPTGNYNNASGTVADSIAKANATINVAPYGVTYDATSHTATGTATGIGSVSLGSDLSLGGTTHANAGTYATDGWTFTDPTGNYNNASGTVADSIAKAALTITAAPNTKTYDGTTTAAGTPTVSGLQGSDMVTGLAEAYNNRNVGTAKTLSVTTYTVNDGNSGGNYTVTSINSTAGVINQAALTITAVSNTKTYDGTTTAAATPTVSGLQGSDTVTGLAEAYSNLNVGAGKTLSVTTYTVNDGNSGGNYTVTSINSTAGVINQAALTITAVSNTKTYDGTTTAAATPTVSGLQGSDTVTGLGEAYSNRNVGMGKTLSVTSYTVNDGNSGGNYTVTSINSTAGVINQAALTITAVPNTKTYDGTTTATATPTVSGLRGSDTVTGLVETYSNRNAGTGKTLSVATYTVNDGNSGGNYTVTLVNSTAGVINQAALTITAAPNTKTYDGTTTAAATPTVSGLQGSDTVTSLAEAYNNRNAGTAKTLSVTTYTVNDGNSGGNYTVTSINSTAGVINQAALTITAVSNTKTYDGTTTATATPTVASGSLASGDAVAFGETYDSQNVGAGKSLTPAGSVADGNAGNNYAVTFVSCTSGVINPLGNTVTLNWSGSGSSLSLTDGTSGGTPAVTISEPSANVSVLKIDLGAGYVFAGGSTTSATGMTYQNPGSPTTSECAMIDISVTDNVSSLVAALPGDNLTLRQIRDLDGGVGSILASAGTIEVTGIDTLAANGNSGLGNVDLRASGDLTVDSGAIIETGTGTLSLAADVNADGTGNDGVGTLSIDAGATVVSTNPTPNAVTLRGAHINIDTTSDQAVVGAPRSLSTTSSLTLPGRMGLAFDSRGDLYVASGAYDICEFAPGATTPTATLTGLDFPGALAFDAAGDLYVANGNSTVSEFAPGATTPTATLTGLNGPSALALDPRGDLYVANEWGNTVSEFAPGATMPTATLSGLDEPFALGFDRSGNLYAANLLNNTVSKFAPGATTPSATLTGLNSPTSLAFDSSGNLYVAGGSTVSKFAPGATTPTGTLTGVNQPFTMAFDAYGNLFVSSYWGTTVSEFAPGAVTPDATLTGLNAPCSLVLDPVGNLFVTTENGNTVNMFAPTVVSGPTAGGVVIRSSLPNLPVSIGNATPPEDGVNLTNAELAQICTTAGGTITFGDSSQTGNITFTTATPVTTAGAFDRGSPIADGLGTNRPRRRWHRNRSER